MIIKKYVNILMAIVFMCCSIVSFAVEQTPQEIVQSTVDKVLSDLKANKELYRKNPEAFHQALHTILSPVVDVDGIAKSVMTVKYSRKISAQQMELFKTNFEKGLMQFYGNALLDFENQGIKIVRARDDNPERASIDMEIKGKNNVIYPVSYTMVKLNGKWMLRNVIVNGLNVGKLFRDQFATEMKNNKNDINKVIVNWADAVKRAKDAADAH